MGRRHEVAEAKRLLSAGRLLTLTGVGGVGKTRLAVRVAEKLLRAFADGVWLVSLAPLQDEALVPHAVADVLGIRDETDRDPLAVLVEHLREQQLLLVLDNCEHLLDACARLVGTVLKQAAGVRVVATSRHRLCLLGEYLLEVQPLPVPKREEPARGVAAAKRFPALELFANRAAAVIPGFAITAENQKAVARLCRRLDGLPLAIELAAVQMRILEIDQLVERLDDRYRLLTGGSGAALPRHQTLRSTVDWSYDLCTPQEQLVWALLSVFAGSADLSAAEAVCAGEDVEPVDVLDVVVGLVDKSILVSVADGSSVRYRLLSSLREYGLEKLNELGKASTVRRRHRDYYLRLAEEYEKQWFGPRQLEIIAHLRAEQDNLRGAFDFCLTTPGEAQLGLKLVGTLWFYWSCCVLRFEVRHWLRNLALCEGVKPRGAPAKAQWASGVVSLIHSRSDTVLQADDRSGRPAPAQADPPVTSLADIVSDRSDLMSFAVLGRVELACSLVFRNSPERAVPLCAEALAVSVAYSEQWARSYVLRTLAMAYWAMGEYDSAITHAHECLRLEYVVHSPQGLSRTLDLLATIAIGKGTAERAAVLLGASEKIWHRIGRGQSKARQLTGQIRVSERRARKTLGDRGFERAFQRGLKLSMDEAVACALRERSEVSRRGAPQETTARAASAELTPRERQVVELVAQGLTDKQIASALVIAQRTAEGHVQRILAKLGLTNRTQVAAAWVSSTHPPGERPQPR
ncbi:putative ATPase/DNA-binding CsgD family transcriptional regulator [Kibdelosporangium banguiense]|uniref:ATPase/DNA-binding CsgD family transcriptional regulator n=1 Tax=Kibdelosporangium banguiense TaxID=1365924 RepID=A0ABS4TVG6_9PSEU|nr:LuxR C-terminal-related transcriptional regulator [Kibdelosporangium banguiense]MBP2328395.1 putative ATPase/DNA-binding CsgD family transcriptional regulator [Kibdelosporangium banguiense]